MKKLTFTSVFSQLLLLLFVIAWIVPTFGLFISSLRDKDVLAISGWWTSFTTTQTYSRSGIMWAWVGPKMGPKYGPTTSLGTRSL